MNKSNIAEKLLNLSNTNPSEAISEARKLADDINSQNLKGSILIDCGLAIGDSASIEEGVKITQEIHKKYPDNLHVQYNLANGLHALAKATEFNDPTWYESTNTLRQDARFLFSEVGKIKNENSELATQSYTNLANLLTSSYRWVEAFDAYNDALKYDSQNGVASSGAAKLLKYCLDIGIGDPESLKRSINRLSKITKDSADTIRKYAGKEASESIASDLEFHEVDDSEVISFGGYEAFVSDHRLALSLTIDDANFDTKRWDDLRIHSVRSGTQESFRVPPIFAMFNMLKSDYMSARWLTYCALNEDIPDSGYYADTLDYANYGTKYSLLTLAQKSAIDVLDKLTVASLEYLNVGGAKNASFKKSWFVQSEDNTLQWNQKIKSTIIDGNKALVALTELSQDFSGKKGYLKNISSLRNAATHRYIALHDMGDMEKIKSKSIEHYDVTNFTNSLIDTLRVVRSSLIYFVEMIAYSEAIKDRDSTGFIGQLDVPSHHHIRDGED